MNIGRLALAAVAAAAMTSAGTAKGTLTWDGKEYEMKYAYAMQAKDKFDKKKDVLRVLVTNIPLEEAVVRSERKLMDLLFNGSITYLDIEVPVDGDSSNYSIHSNEHKGSLSGSNTPSILKITNKTDNKLEGEAARKASDFGGSNCEFSIQLEADILKPVVVPQPTPADALAAAKTESAKAYLAFNQALMAGNKALLMQGVIAEKAKMIDTPDFPKMLKMIQSMQPRQVRVKKAIEDGEQSRLWVSGLEGAKAVKGVVEMVKESGKWKVRSESWGGDWE